MRCTVPYKGIVDQDKAEVDLSGRTPVPLSPVDVPGLDRHRRMLRVVADSPADRLQLLRASIVVG